MRAQDYTYVDVTGVSIADKILPRIYNEANGAAKVERAEDLAFLWEAVSERHGRAARLMPDEFEQGTSSPGAINVLSRFHGVTYADAGGPTLVAYESIRGLMEEERRCTDPPRTPSKYVDISGNVTWGHYDGWFDWSKVGGVVRREDLTSSEAAGFDIVSVFPGLFTGVSIPSDDGRYSDRRIMVDPLRYLYSRLAHSEGFVAWHDVDTWFTCVMHRKTIVGKGTAATTTLDETESYGQLGSGTGVTMYWQYTPEEKNESGEVVQEEERSVQELKFGYVSAIAPPVTYSGGRGLGTATGTPGEIPVMIIRFHVRARPLDSVNSTLFPEKDTYIVDYLNMNQGTADLQTKFNSLYGRFFPQTNYSYISITASFGPFLFPFSGKTKLRDLAGGAWDPARRS